jgi:hypothetical protein
MAEMTICNRAAAHVGFDNLNEIEVPLVSNAVKPKEKWRKAEEGQKEQKERSVQHWNSNPDNALRTGIIKGHCEYRELVLVAELLQHAAMAPTYWACRRDVVVKDGDTHSTCLGS